MRLRYILSEVLGDTRSYFGKIQEQLKRLVPFCSSNFANQLENKFLWYSVFGITNLRVFAIRLISSFTYMIGWKNHLNSGVGKRKKGSHGCELHDYHGNFVFILFFYFDNLI